MQVVVCIPTMRRAKPFLVRSLPRYLEMDFVSQVIVTDETGEDIDVLRQELPSDVFNHSKLRLIKNAKRLGPFLNKRKVVELAPKDSWVALLDSDNFAPADTFFHPWLALAPHNKSTVYVPGSSTSPLCSGSSISSQKMHATTLTSQNIKSIIQTDDLRRQAFCVLNTGNFIVKRETYLCQCPPGIQHILCRFREPRGSPADAAFQSILLLCSGAILMSTPQMSYEHEVHSGSMCIETNKTSHGQKDLACVFHLLTALF